MFIISYGGTLGKFILWWFGKTTADGGVNLRQLISPYFLIRCGVYGVGGEFILARQIKNKLPAQAQVLRNSSSVDP
jgi:hypothetical protein